MALRMLSKTLKKPTTVNDTEIAKFSAMADEWWDPTGKFKPLHEMNPLRLRYIKDKTQNITGLQILDIGCGGGLIAEPLARMEAQVTAVDASEKNIQIAKLHAEKEGLKIDYRFATAEELSQNGETFDIVTALEIIEHVDNVPAFIAACAALVKPGGLLFISTLNRTPQSYLAAIVGAEYLLRWLPVGTHDWQKFLKPAEIIMEAEKNSVALEALDGFRFNPITRHWKISKDVSINYMLVFKKS